MASDEYSVFWEVSGDAKWVCTGRNSGHKFKPGNLCITKHNNGLLCIQIVFDAVSICDEKPVRVAPSSKRVKLVHNVIREISYRDGKLTCSFSDADGLLFMLADGDKAKVEIVINILKTLKSGLKPVLLNGKVTPQKNPSPQVKQNLQKITELCHNNGRCKPTTPQKNSAQQVKRNLQKTEELSHSNERFKPKKCVIPPKGQRKQVQKQEVKLENTVPVETSPRHNNSLRSQLNEDDVWSHEVTGRASKNVIPRNGWLKTENKPKVYNSHLNSIINDDDGPIKSKNKTETFQDKKKSDKCFPSEMWSVFEEKPATNKQVLWEEDDMSDFDVSVVDLVVSPKKEPARKARKRSGLLNIESPRSQEKKARLAGKAAKLYEDDGNKENDDSLLGDILALSTSPQKKQPLNERTVQHVTPKQSKIPNIKSFYNTASRNSGRFGITYDRVKSPAERKLGLLKDPRSRRIVATVSPRKSAVSPPPSHGYFSNGPTSNGFANIGNTCYMNAILQSLLCLVPFVQDLANKDILKLVNHSSLYRRMYELYLCKDEKVEVGVNSRKERSLKNLKGAISQPEMINRFSGYLQNDAHEFMNACLDQIKEEVKKVLVGKTKQENIQSKSTLENIQAKLCPVIRNFEGCYRKYITCKGCFDLATKDELFYHVSLNIPQHKRSPDQSFTLRELLRIFFQEEELERKCEKCECTRATQSFKIQSLPRVMVFHMLRHKFHKTLGIQEKKSDKIKTDRYIDMDEYCNPDVKGPVPFSVKSIGPAKLLHFDNETPSSDTDDFVVSKPRRRLDMSSCETPTASKSSGNGNLTTSSSWPKPCTETPKLSSELAFESEQLSKMSMDEQIQLATQESLKTNISEEEMIKIAQRKSLETKQQEDDIFMDAFPTLDLLSDEDLQEIDIKTNSVLKDRLSGEQVVPSNTSQDCNILKQSKNTGDDSAGTNFRKRISSDSNGVSTSVCDGEKAKTKNTEGDVNTSTKKRKVQHEETPKIVVYEDQSDELQRALEESKLTCQQADEEWQLIEAKKRSLNDNTFYAETVEKIDENSAHQYRLLSVVNHVGNKTAFGHYFSDVFDLKLEQWVRCDDATVVEVDEHLVRYNNTGEGYIYFYMHKSLTEQVLAHKDKKR